MDFTFFNQLILMLSLSVVTVAVFKRLNIPESLGYICVGIILGPVATGLIQGHQDIGLLAEIGVVFLLFTLGLEFSLRTIKKMQKEVFGLGGMQVFLSMIGLFLGLILLKFQPIESMVISGALALSSTAIVSKELTQRNELQSRHGQLVIGTLLFQDIAAVIFLIVLPVIAGSGGQESLLSSFLLTFTKGGVFVFAMLAAGKWVLPALFHEIAKARSEELFVLMALITALMAAWIAHFLGLSMALGGFVAGMMLGESTYKHQLEADIKPFRDVLLGLFFISIGLMLDPVTLKQSWPIILLATGILILFKFIVVAFITRSLNENRETAVRTGIFLCQGGEFCFALLALALSYGQIEPELASIALSVTISSMVLAPLLIRNSHRLSYYLSKKEIQTASSDTDNNEIRKQTAHIQDHTLICGYGRVGQTISRFLHKEQKKFIAIDDDPLHVHEARLANEPVFYGDCQRLDLLEAVGLLRANLVVICVDKVQTAMNIVKTIRGCQCPTPILVRTRYDDSVDALLEAGATVAIPEVLESSLLIAEHALTMLGLPDTVVRDRIDGVREERYATLSGYYPSICDFKASNNKKAIRHAITITEQSNIDGLTIKDLDINPDKVRLIEIRRCDETIQPSDDLILHSGDILVLKGDNKSIQYVENELEKFSAQ
ncbi:Glutathione-regulated potassium-efflux system protein KefC [invertebrate metagenome]|uniref:Glutathione-regulated potassium-efflux system protein KefC n=1 Tax=invertebrate metagenome TaxID=1711999 RepID=A0A2H9T723_9ZZZZ